MAVPPPSAPDRVVQAFLACLGPVLGRGLRQAGREPLSDAHVEALARAVLDIGAEGGWARRFAGAREDLRPEEVAEWSTRLGAVVPGRAAELGTVFKQVLKSCFQPPPAQCRNSFCETDSAGRCRRQERVYDLARLSGAHCVDCPYWLELNGDEHFKFLADRWLAGVDDLEAHRAVYLPEDFRTLRGWRPGVEGGS
jgi:hypothetical protein